MIRKVRSEDIEACAETIRTSFLTVAEEFGFTPENAPRFTAFAVTPPRRRGGLAAGPSKSASSRKTGFFAAGTRDWERYM